MRLRTKLIIAFLLLAVLPLSGIVLYSYSTSLNAFRQAVEAESLALAEEMTGRLSRVRDDLNQRLEGLGRLNIAVLHSPNAEAAGGAGKVYSELMADMGEMAPLVSSFEFIPARPPEPVLPPHLARPPDPDVPAPAAPQQWRLEAEIVAEEGDVSREWAAAAEPLVIYPSETIAKALERLEEVRLENLGVPGLPPELISKTIREAVKERKLLEAKELDALEASEARTRSLMGQDFSSPVLRGEELVGYLKARVRTHQIVRQVLEDTDRRAGDVPYSMDADGRLYVASASDRELLTSIAVPATAPQSASVQSLRKDWIVVETQDPDSGLTFGVARPIRQSLREIRRTAVSNFVNGLAMVVLALFGVVWLSGRMTRNLTTLTEGAERLATGDLDTRVSVRSRDELGRLASTFNRMAQEMGEQQKRIIEEERKRLTEERKRKEQEIQQRLLEAEHERKSRELEEARQFQLSMLPKELPEHPDIEIAVFMQTATEVGGDYYDFLMSEEGALTAAVGDATGHGAKAGTMVSVIKGLILTRAEAGLPEFLGAASGAIKRMGLGRMNMALALLRIDGRRVTVASAGMPPVLLYRAATGKVEEVALEATPLGSLADYSYPQWQSELLPGDTALLMTDGFPELLNAAEEPLGYPQVRAFFAASAWKPPQEIVSDLAAAAEARRPGAPPNDDITFVVLKMKGPGP